MKKLFYSICLVYTNRILDLQDNLDRVFVFIQHLGYEVLWQRFGDISEGQNCSLVARRPLGEYAHLLNNYMIERL